MPLHKTKPTLHKTEGKRARALPKKRMQQLQLPATKSRVVERQIAGLELIDGSAVVYQLERVKCGKDACKVCRAGGSHGPYWYAYFRQLRRTRSIYIGKELRPVQQVLDARKAAANG